MSTCNGKKQCVFGRREPFLSIRKNKLNKCKLLSDKGKEYIIMSSTDDEKGRRVLCGELSIDDLPSDSELSDDVFCPDQETEDSYFIESTGSKCFILAPGDKRRDSTGGHDFKNLTHKQRQEVWYNQRQKALEIYDNLPPRVPRQKKVESNSQSNPLKAKEDALFEKYYKKLFGDKEEKTIVSQQYSIKCNNTIESDLDDEGFILSSCESKNRNNYKNKLSMGSRVDTCHGYLSSGTDDISMPGACTHSTDKLPSTSTDQEDFSYRSYYDIHDQSVKYSDKSKDTEKTEVCFPRELDLCRTGNVELNERLEWNDTHSIKESCFFEKDTNTVSSHRLQGKGFSSPYTETDLHMGDFYKCGNMPECDMINTSSLQNKAIEDCHTLRKTEFTLEETHNSLHNSHASKRVEENVERDSNVEGICNKMDNHIELGSDSDSDSMQSCGEESAEVGSRLRKLNGLPLNVGPGNNLNENFSMWPSSTTVGGNLSIISPVTNPPVSNNTLGACDVKSTLNSTSKQDDGSAMNLASILKNTSVDKIGIQQETGNQLEQVENVLPFDSSKYSKKCTLESDHNSLKLLEKQFSLSGTSEDYHTFSSSPDDFYESPDENEYFVQELNGKEASTGFQNCRTTEMLSCLCSCSENLVGTADCKCTKHMMSKTKKSKFDEFPIVEIKDESAITSIKNLESENNSVCHKLECERTKNSGSLSYKNTVQSESLDPVITKPDTSSMDNANNSEADNGTNNECMTAFADKSHKSIATVGLNNCMVNQPDKMPINGSEGKYSAVAQEIGNGETKNQVGFGTVKITEAEVTELQLKRITDSASVSEKQTIENTEGNSNGLDGRVPCSNDRNLKITTMSKGGAYSGNKQPKASKPIDSEVFIEASFTVPVDIQVVNLSPTNISLTENIELSSSDSKTLEKDGSVQLKDDDSHGYMNTVNDKLSVDKKATCRSGQTIGRFKEVSKKQNVITSTSHKVCSSGGNRLEVSGEKASSDWSGVVIHPEVRMQTDSKNVAQVSVANNKVTGHHIGQNSPSLSGTVISGGSSSDIGGGGKENKPPAVSVSRPVRNGINNSTTQMGNAGSIVQKVRKSKKQKRKPQKKNKCQSVFTQTGRTVQCGGSSVDVACQVDFTDESDFEYAYSDH